MGHLTSLKEDLCSLNIFLGTFNGIRKSPLSLVLQTGFKTERNAFVCTTGISISMPNTEMQNISEAVKFGKKRFSQWPK